MSVDIKKRVLIITNEMSPYLEMTFFASILNQLAVKTFEASMEIRVIMPRFGSINERRHRLHEVVRLSGINIIIDKDDYPLQIKVASLPNARLQVYFMENEDFFKRKQNFTNEDGSFYDDNADRMVFFCKSALETVKKFGWPPHVIHCHGWMSALIPLYIKTAYKKEPVFNYSKVLFTAQENQFSEKLNADFISKALLGNEIKEKDFAAYKESTYLALSLGAVQYADGVIVGDKNLDKKLEEALVPSKNKKIIPFEESWKEDVLPLIEVYKSFSSH